MEARNERRRRRDVWEALDAALDVSRQRPRLGDHVEIKDFHLRWNNDYSVAGNRRELVYYRLEPAEAALVGRMDGSRTVSALVVEHLEASGELAIDEVTDLVVQLRRGGFLDQRPVDVEAALERALAPRGVRAAIRRFLRTLMIEWNDAERLVRWLYDHGLKLVFRRTVAVIMAVCAVGGLVAFAAVVDRGGVSLVGEEAAAEAAVILLLSYVLTFVHELGHALVLLHYRRRIKSAGFLLYFGTPTFFIESSDGLMLDRRRRVLQSFAGPYAELIVAGAASIAVLILETGTTADALYKLALLSYFEVALNLVPFLELDGYWIFSDLIEVPDLRARSLQFLRRDFWRKLRRRERFTRPEVGLAVYSALGLLFTVISIIGAVYFWQEFTGAVVRRIWDGGPLARVLLVIAGLVLAGPVLRMLLDAARAVGRELRTRWRRTRFRLETGWRIEAARLLDALPIFDDLPVERLNDIAGRVELIAARAGEAIVRQGDPSDALYVIRAGTVRVVEENRSTGEERTLRTLGVGEAFGEVGVAAGGRRRATVRAIEKTELFRIGKATFDRLLAREVDLPHFATTAQDAEELRSVRCFALLEPDERWQLAERGAWERHPAGAVVVEEGAVGDAFYGVGAGQLDVVQDGQLVTRLGSGDHFGELALLLDAPRAATVRAVTPTHLFRVDRAAFDDVVRGSFKRPTGPGPARLARVAEH